MNGRKTVLFALMAGTVASVAHADFVDDEFDGATLGAQWTYFEGVSTLTSATTTTIQPNTPVGHLTLTVSKGADSSWDIDNGAYIQQDQPSEDTWEIRTKVDNWDPRIAPNTAEWQKFALQIHQDNNHWVSIAFTRRNTNEVNLYAQSQFTVSTANPSPTVDRIENTIFTYGVTTPSLHLRIQKTSKGYRTGYSVNGTDWIDRGSFARNPHSADGFLSPNAKIRILVSAAGGTGEVDPVEIDWIRKSSYPATAAGYADDEFDGTSLGANWLYVPGLGTPGVTTGSITVADGKLKMLPNASGIDIGPNAENVPVVMQDAPADANYTLTTKVGPTNFTSASNWAGHGIRLWQDQNHWVMIKMTRNGTAGTGGRNYFEARHQDDEGTSTSSNTGTFGTSSSSPGPEYLRIEKQGSKYRLRYSFDGGNWVNASNTAQYPDGWIDFGTELKNPQVQLLVKRPNTGGTIITSEFDFLRKNYQGPTSAQDWQLFE